VDTILLLANKGVEVFRLDAVAFLWKRLGTTCQNLPEVHDLLQALVQATRAAPPASSTRPRPSWAPATSSPIWARAGTRGA
jgi:amylosucrase